MSDEYPLDQACRETPVSSRAGRGLLTGSRRHKEQRANGPGNSRHFARKEPIVMRRKELSVAGANGISRRSSLVALVGALTAAVVAPPLAGSGAPKAGKIRKKERKVCAARLQAQADESAVVCDARLQAQEEASRVACDLATNDALEKQLSRVRLTDKRFCEDAVADICENESTPEACVIEISPCCDSFVDNDPGEAARCLLLALLP